MEATIGDDAGMDVSSGEFIKRLDDSTTIQVLQLLHKISDIANASCVCRSWRRCVMEGQLWKGLCLQEFPEVRTFEEVVETDLSRDVKAATGSSSGHGSSFRHNIESEERIYRHLLRELIHEPLLDRSCIGEAIGASSTDHDPEESIIHTLHPYPAYADDDQTPSYWSSTGQLDVSVPETLTYKLVSQLCVVHEVRIRPYQAYRQFNAPIYSAEHVRIRLGYELDCSEGENSPLVASAGRSPMAAGPSPEDYVWTYESPKFPMKQVNSLQSFKLPRPVLCVGGVMQVELLGRVQKQRSDQAYYFGICHVRVQAWPLFDFRAHWNRDGKGLCLEYRGNSAELNEKGKGLCVECGGKAESNENETYTVPIDWEEENSDDSD